MGYFFTEKQNISIDIRIKKAYNVIKVKARRLNQSTILTERKKATHVKEEGKEAMRVSRKAINSFPFPKTGRQLEKER